MPFKNVDPDELLRKEDVKKQQEYAGILADDVILIDIDDPEQSEILYGIVEDLQLVCRVYQTTRGKHFIFLNVDETGKYIQETCKTHCNLAIGLNADIKIGCKNSYSILKYKGKEREIIYDKLDDEEYQIVPKFLLPIHHKQNFLSMDAGSGRKSVAITSACRK